MSQFPGQTLNTVVESYLHTPRPLRESEIVREILAVFPSRTAPCWWKTCASGCCFVGAARPKTPDQKFSSHHGRPRAGHFVFGDSNGQRATRTDSPT